MIFRFGQKKAAGEFLAAAGLWGAFDKMLNECPGAAYIFARTMLNGQPIMTSASTPANKRLSLDRAIAESVPHSRADGGISLLAMRAMRQALDCRDAAARTTYMDTFEAISKHGASYRELDDIDYDPPEEIDDEEMINKMGGSSLGHVIDNLEISAAAEGGTPREIAETVDTIVATYDIRGEIRSGALKVHVRHIQMILALQV